MATNGEISESTEKTKSIRFTVSQVETEEVVIKPGRRPSGLYDLQEGTVGRSSLGYTTLNTQEAYPNTLYYRDQDSSQVLWVMYGNFGITPVWWVMYGNFGIIPV